MMLQIKIEVTDNYAHLIFQVKAIQKCQHSSFFKSEEIFIQLDELDRITHAWIGLNCSLTEAQKAVWCNG